MRPRRELMTAEEAAALLRIEPQTLRKKAQARTVPHYKIPGAGLRFERSELEEWIDRFRVQDRWQAANYD